MQRRALRRSRHTRPVPRSKTTAKPDQLEIRFTGKRCAGLLFVEQVFDLPVRCWWQFSALSWCYRRLA
jgi:hypothetical protein